MKLDLHHKLFFTWLAWCGIGIFFSEYPLMAFQGFYPYRGEGLLTFLILTCFALSYWKVFDSLRPLGWIMAGICLFLFIAFVVIVYFWEGDYGDRSYAKNFFDRALLPDVAVASFACQTGAIMAYIHPLLGLIAALPLVDAASRSGLIALFVSLTTFVILTKKTNLTISSKKLGKYCLVGIVVLGLSFLLVGKIVGMNQKLTSIPKIQTMGSGARSQWILQGANLASRLPLTGFGLDTLSNYLQTPTGGQWKEMRRYISDRTHNIMYDIILQTGWVGFTMLLLTLGYAVAICVHHPDRHNIACLCALIAWGIFAHANPHGMLGNSTALICLFGIRKTI